MSKTFCKHTIRYGYYPPLKPACEYENSQEWTEAECFYYWELSDKDRACADKRQEQLSSEMQCGEYCDRLMEVFKNCERHESFMKYPVERQEV